MKESQMLTFFILRLDFFSGATLLVLLSLLCSARLGVSSFASRGTALRMYSRFIGARLRANSASAETVAFSIMVSCITVLSVAQHVIEQSPLCKSNRRRLQ